MKIHLKKIFHPVNLLTALAKTVAVLLSYLFGSYITGHFHMDSRWMGAMLAAVSALVVLQGDLKSTIRLGRLRVLGTFIGSVIGYLYLIFFPFTFLGMVVTVFLLDLLCMLFGIPDDGKMATMALVIILIVSQMSPSLSPLLNGTLRFSEATVGALIGISMAWLVERVEARRKKHTLK